MNTSQILSESKAASLAKFLKIREQLEKTMAFSSVYPDNATVFESAPASSRLCPLMKKELKGANLKESNPANVFIVGSDGSYFEIGDDNWKKTLLEWSDKGLTRFTYLLRSAEVKAKKQISSILGQAKRPDLINFVTFKSDVELPENIKYFYERWETKHFVIGLDPKFLWMEANHPPGKKEAFYCAYLDKSACATSRDWEICKNAVNTVSPYLVPVLN